MHYLIAANWDLGLLKRIEGTSVSGLYGQIWGDPLGGGRMALFIPKVGKEEAFSFIAEARKRGLEFNYLVNASCFDNLEFTKKGYEKIAEHLNWISSTGGNNEIQSCGWLVLRQRSGATCRFLQRLLRGGSRIPRGSHRSPQPGDGPVPHKTEDRCWC